MKDVQPIRKEELLIADTPDAFGSVAIAVSRIVTGLSQSQIEAIAVKNYWIVWQKNNSRLALLTQPSVSQSENVGWLQEIQIPVDGGRIVMENTPSGVPAEMRFMPSPQFSEAGERQFLFIANEIDLGRKCTVVDFVKSTRLAIAAMYGLLEKKQENEALAWFNFPHTLDYSLANILQRINRPKVRDLVRSCRIRSLIETHQPARALAQIDRLSTRQESPYTDNFIDELKAAALEQDKK